MSYNFFNKHDKYVLKKLIIFERGKKPPEVFEKSVFHHIFLSENENL